MSTPTMTTTTYVTYLYPGTFFAEESKRAVDRRDPQRTARGADPSVFAFTFHDEVTTTAVVDGQEVTLSSKAINKSGRYYIDAQPFTAAQVAALPGDHEIVLSNMRANGWDPILKCRTGNWQPLEPGDEIVHAA
jgi:hypothetical protein